MMPPNELDDLLRKIAETRQAGQEVVRSLQSIMSRLTEAAQQESRVGPPANHEMTAELMQDITGRC